MFCLALGGAAIRNPRGHPGFWTLPAADGLEFGRCPPGRLQKTMRVLPTPPEFVAPGCETVIEESIYLSDSYGHRRSEQIVVYGRVAHRREAAWQFRRTAAPQNAQPRRRLHGGRHAELLQLPVDGTPLRRRLSPGRRQHDLRACRCERSRQLGHAAWLELAWVVDRCGVSASFGRMQLALCRRRTETEFRIRCLPATAG